MNCQRRNVQCSFQVYDPATPSRLAQINTLNDPLLSFPVPLSPVSHSTGNHDLQQALQNHSTQRALLDLLAESDRSLFTNVLLHYADKTVPTLFFGSKAHMAWSGAIPALATSFRFVLHGILALGCLHLSILDTTMSGKKAYEDLAADQLNMGMVQYREELQEVTTANSEALFAFSTTVTSYVLFTVGGQCKTTLETIRNSNDINTERRVELTSSLSQTVCTAFRAQRGVLVIFVPCWHHIRNGPLEPIVARDWWPTGVPSTQDQIDFDTKLRQVETMWSRPGKQYEYRFDTYRSALKGLRETCAIVSKLADDTPPGNKPGELDFDWTAIFHWTSSLPMDFIVCLEAQEMEAWVLAAHWAMLFAKIPSNFWLDGLGSSIVRTAAVVIGEENWAWITWPAAVLGVNLLDFQACKAPPLSN